MGGDDWRFGEKARPSFWKKRSKKRFSGYFFSEGADPTEKSFSVLFFKKGLLSFLRDGF
jgi:hypothetical protein